MNFEPTITLRALEPEDLELVYQIENDPSLWQWGCNNVPYSHYTIRQYLEEQKCDIYVDGQLRQAITLDGKAAGIIDLCHFDASHLRAEVGIVVLRPYWHQGIASAALRLLHDYAARRLRLRSLYAFVSERNTPAQSLFNSLGYRTSGMLPRWIEGEETAIMYQVLL